MPLCVQYCALLTCRWELREDVIIFVSLSQLPSAAAAADADGDDNDDAVVVT